MTELTQEEVQKVAQLAYLEFSDSEFEEMRSQLSHILSYVEILNQVDTENVEPLAHPIEVVDVFREDVLTEMLPIEDALKNAPSTDGTFFHVPAILDAGE